MVSFQIVSDLHLESPPAYDIFDITPKAPYLALLGDIGNVVRHKNELLSFLTRQIRQFQAVLFVPGNHEAYGSTWPDALDILRQFERDVDEGNTDNGGRFVLLDRSVFELPTDGKQRIVVLGCSLFSNVPPARAMAVEIGLNDFFSTKSWTVKDHNAAHQRDLTWLNEQVEQIERRDDRSVKVAIFTHWSPSVDDRAVDAKHAKSAITSAFATDLSDEKCWTSNSVVLWAFGHTHYNCDFTLERKDARPLRLMANQRGYYFAQAEGFDGEKVVDLS